VYVAGNFLSPILHIGSSTFYNAGNYDIFLVKYDSVGNPIWAKSAGGAGLDHGTALTTNATGDVYLTGRFGSSALTFGTATITNTSSSGNDVYLTKYSASGLVNWARVAGGTGNDDPSSIAVDATGKIYVAGGSSAAFSFGSTSLSGGAFLLEYTDSGTQKWASCSGLPAQSAIYSIAIQGNKSIYVAGVFRCSTITFGSTALTKVGGGVTNDIFLARLDDTTSNILIVDTTNIDTTLNIRTNAYAFAFVYPNPTTGIVNISNPTPIKELIILNQLGQPVYLREYITTSILVDLTSLPAGVYYIKIDGLVIKLLFKV
jgi:hypothetical protein